MKITIKLVSNGALVTCDEESEGSGDSSEKREGIAETVYTFDSYAKNRFGEDSLDGMVSLLNDVVDCMGFSGSGHDRERLQVRVVHGHKWDGHNDADAKKDCTICQDAETYIAPVQENNI